MKYVASISPVIAVILLNVTLGATYNVEPTRAAFLVWCLVSGFVAGWFGAEIFLKWDRSKT